MSGSTGSMPSAAQFFADRRAPLDEQRVFTLPGGTGRLYLVHQWADVRLFADLTALPAVIPAPRSEWPDATFDFPAAVDPFAGDTIDLGSGPRAIDVTTVPWLSATDAECPMYLHFPEDAHGPSEVWSLRLIAWRLQVELQAQDERVFRQGRSTWHAKHLEDWIARTRALVSAMPSYIERAAIQAMRQAADRAEGNLRWPAEHLVKAPRDGNRLEDLRLAMLAWCVDECIVACNRFQPLRTRVTVDRGTALRMALPASDAFDPQVWTMRVRRFRRGIRPGHHEALMADALNSLRTAP